MRMKHICPFIFLLFIGLSSTFLFAQSEDEFFHKAGFEYYKADYPKAHEIVVNGLEKYNSSEKLTKLKELICEQWPGCEGNIEPPEPPPCNGNDRDGDGICDDEDYCPDVAGVPHPQNNGCPLDSDGDGIWDRNDPCPNDPYDNCNQEQESDEPVEGPEVAGPVEISGCMDRAADNYKSNATTPCRNCCRYTINTQFKRVPGQNKMTWNPKLAEKATSIQITYTIKPVDGNNETLVDDYVTGKSYHLYDPQTWKADQIETDIRLIITTDSKTTVVGSRIKVDELFDCSSY